MMRLRLAPSPTGFLHIGNLRTALFGYLLAKSGGGQFILRVEDTDQKREVAGAVDSLIEILAWAGISFDEGPHLSGPHAPYIQSQRLDIYRKLADQLIASGGAYRCFCDQETLASLRTQQQTAKQAPRYDRRCRRLSAEQVAAKVAAGEAYVVRQALPESGSITVHDELRGDIVFNLVDLEDHVLIKSDGVPTYQFASVVDDHLMDISHVTRGDEWLPSFPKNVLLYQAFGWEPPKFIHLPLILNKSGGKLSKRQGDVFVEQYRDKGYLPEALLNFCALLGWHPTAQAVSSAGKDKEIFSLADLVKIFSIEGLGVSPAVFDLEKLDYYNGWYIRAMDDQTLLERLRPFWSLAAETDAAYLLKIIPTVKERLKRLSDIDQLTGFYFVQSRLDYQETLLKWKDLSLEQVKLNLAQLTAWLEAYQGDWQTAALEREIVGRLKEANLKIGDYLWPLRVALTGLAASPGPFEVAGVLGKDLTLSRLRTAG